ncbi:MAG: hypothetical protein COV47_04460 [Candidatus Diapherotrites archaeon CG11_big_fil_rev_8_21_14_0_20_37_9]|nr:MAG: hypothetical protein COV47_04460 [Candidatus Diapherotrites archaeon CG11_big_fil_rev_8_21_14_0_20_37_9]
MVEDDRSIAINPIDIDEFVPTKTNEDGKFRYSYTIPQFQRDFVWEYKDVKDLWDSIYRNYPLGSFMIWESQEELSNNRQIAENISLVKTEGNTFKYILDGQQRITSLIVSVLGGLKRKENRKRPMDLAVYLSLKNAKIEIDEINFENKKKIQLFFTKNDIKKWTEEEKKYLIDVKQLITFNDEIYSKFYDTEEKELAKLYQKISHRINKYKLSIITLKNIPREEVCELFTRVNTQGKKLSTIDLITAYTYSDDFYLRGDNYLEKLFGGAGDLERLNYENIDELLFIRLISMIKLGQCAESDLFELKSKDFKENWKIASDSFIEAIQFLRNHLNIMSPTILPYSPMLVSLAYFFYLIRKNRVVETNKIKDSIEKWFWIKSLNEDYRGATNEEIKKDCTEFNNFIKNNNGFSFSLTRNITKEILLDEKLNLSSGFCKTILCIFAKNKPFDFTNHKEVNIYDVLVEYKKSELHHIFPQKSRIASEHSKDKINKILNICFLPKSSNGSISNDNPSVYFIKKVKEKNSHYIEDIKSNIIPEGDESGIWNDKYEKFLEQRSDLILNEIKRLAT